jgi:hypothetical protein
MTGDDMKIRVMGTDCNIKQDTNRLDDMGALSEGFLLGAYLPHENTILLRDNSPADLLKDILWHEVLECGNHKLEWNLEHSTLSSIASFIDHVVEDNPHLFKNKFKGVKS